MVRKPLRDLALEDWSRVIATNLTSTYLLARAAEDLLRAAHGSIVAIASTRAHQSEPDTESYAASKGGLVALTHALAISLGPEIRTNVISPGWINVTGDEPSRRDHEQHPAGRVGRPEDIAALAAWLLGPESGFVTGAEFVSDGGMTRKMIYEGRSRDRSRHHATTDRTAPRSPAARRTQLHATDATRRAAARDRTVTSRPYTPRHTRRARLNGRPSRRERRHEHHDRGPARPLRHPAARPRRPLRRTRRLVDALRPR
ncbi:SDR family oxidoreductase [Roseomonas sp. CCTCC AB2023176]|uniref:SDR family oxidoreductase n=1 Tax=Roseomonas sp. CCTCC AB2023176 TaxID=3342640 RepID=UPI0035DFC8FE